MQPSEQHVGTREGYDRWSACYDSYKNPLIALEEPEVRDFLGSVTDLDVLDLACGTGRHTLRMAREGARVTGVDFSAGMLDVARRVTSNVRWMQADLQQALPFEDASFDRVVHALALDHLDEPVMLLKELRRVLRPGGTAAITVMHPAMFLKGTQARFVDPESGDLVVIDNRQFTISEFVMAVRAADLELIDMRERKCTAKIAESIPRAVKYVDWPMLLLMGVRRRPN